MAVTSGRGVDREGTGRDWQSRPRLVLPLAAEKSTDASCPAEPHISRLTVDSKKGYLKSCGDCNKHICVCWLMCKWRAKVFHVSLPRRMLFCRRAQLYAGSHECEERARMVSRLTVVCCSRFLTSVGLWTPVAWTRVNRQRHKITPSFWRPLCCLMTHRPRRYVV